MIDEEEAVEKLMALRDALRRLSDLAEESESRMAVQDIVNAVLGNEPESDTELVRSRVLR